MTDFREQLQAALGTSFTLGRELSGAGMSRVFVAADVTLGRQVVVKVLPPELAADVSVERFRREIRLAAQLQEPLIVPVLAAGESHGLVYYTMPLVEGESLRARLERERELPQGDVVRIMRDVLTALAYAHAHGVIHRDIKPANVLLTGPHAVVADFGIAKALTASLTDNRITATGIALGTPAYMAPEQAMGDDSVDHRADLYAVGTLAYEMLAGHTPFTGSTTHQVVARVVTENPQALLSQRSSTSPALADLVHRLLAKNPADRPKSAADVLDELATISTSGERAVQVTASAFPPPKPHAQRWAKWSVVAAAVLIAAVVGLPRLRSAVSGASSDEKAGPALEQRLRTIAVLPFTNESVDRQNEFLANGITDGLNGALTALPGVRVTGRTSAYAVQGKNLDERAIGVMLGATTLVEGSVARSGDSMRVRVQLVNAADRASVWSNAYYRKVGDVFAVQDEIVRAIVSALQVQLAAGGSTPYVSGLTASADAYDLYVHGMALHHARTDQLRAIQYFKEAIARDSLFAEPHAGLTDVYVNMINDLGRNDLREPAKAEALRAIALRPQSGEAHASLGSVLLLDRDLPGAEREFRRAIELAPSCLTAHDHLALVLAFRGQRDESFRESRLARGIDPISGIIADHGFWIFGMGRQYDSSLVEARRGSAIAGGKDPWYHYVAGGLFASQGRFPDALAEYRTGIALDKQDTLVSLDLAYVYAKEGKRADAERILARSLALGDSAAKENAGGLALLYAALGDKDRAFNWLAIEAMEPVLAPLSIGTEAEYDQLHSDPRWPPLMRQLGLAP